MKHKINTVQVVGFFPVQGVDRDDYRDWLRIRELSLADVRNSLIHGSFPPGLLLHDATADVQVFQEGDRQVLRRWARW
jgi:hypothetical protein